MNFNILVVVLGRNLNLTNLDTLRREGPLSFSTWKSKKMPKIRMINKYIGQIKETLAQGY